MRPKDSAAAARSRSQAAHESACVDGQRTHSCVPPRVSSMWMSEGLSAVASSVAGAAGPSSTGMNYTDAAAGSAAACCTRATVLGAASPVRLMPRPTRHLRMRLTFKPWSRAMAATDAPGSGHSARTCAFNSAPCIRRWDLRCIGAPVFELVSTIVTTRSAMIKMERLDTHPVVVESAA